MRTLFLLILVICVSCNSQKRTQRYLFEHPEFSAEYCAEQFPAQDSVIVKEMVRYDTVLDFITWVDTVIKNDTVYTDSVRTVYKTITKTVRRDSIIYRLNTAEVEKLQHSLQACQTNNNALLSNYNKQAGELAEWKGRAKTRFWWILLLIGGGVVYAGVKLKKYFLT